VKHFAALNDDENGRFYRPKVATSKTQQTGRHLLLELPREAGPFANRPVEAIDLRVT
jgi:hypothetical protein